jgi:hypothetical protein
LVVTANNIVMKYSHLSHKRVQHKVLCKLTSPITSKRHYFRDDHLIFSIMMCVDCLLNASGSVYLSTPFEVFYVEPGEELKVNNDLVEENV